MSSGTYYIKEHSPILGTRVLWRVSTCASCGGSGGEYYAGCCDSVATCNRCDGTGQVGVFKRLDSNGNAFGPWKRGGEG